MFLMGWVNCGSWHRRGHLVIWCQKRRSNQKSPGGQTRWPLAVRLAVWLAVWFTPLSTCTFPSPRNPGGQDHGLRAGVLGIVYQNGGERLGEMRAQKPTQGLRRGFIWRYRRL